MTSGQYPLTRPINTPSGVTGHGSKGRGVAARHKRRRAVQDGKRTDNGIDAYKYLAMSMRKKGMELNEISAAFGIPHETIRRWITEAHREGLAGVPHGKVENHARLSVEDRGELVSDILLTRPREHGHDSSAWDDATARAPCSRASGTPLPWTRRGRGRRRAASAPRCCPCTGRASRSREERMSAMSGSTNTPQGDRRARVRLPHCPVVGAGRHGHALCAIVEVVLYVMRSKTGREIAILPLVTGFGSARRRPWLPRKRRWMRIASGTRVPSGRRVEPGAAAQLTIRLGARRPRPEHPTNLCPPPI